MANAAPEKSPIDLSAKMEGDTVVLVLASLPSERGNAIYSLEVDGASSIRQKGHARLSPHSGATLVRVTIDGKHPWVAKLQVETSDRTFERSITSIDRAYQ